MPAFAHWVGKIKPHSRSAEIASSLDVFPTFTALAGLPLPSDRPYDGRDLTQVLFGGTSKHKDDFLFFYDDCHIDEPYYTVTAVRHGKYKAHWCTAPGNGQKDRRDMIKVYDRYPLLFDVEKDPSESMPLSEGDMPQDPEHQEAMERIMKAYAMEKATFVFGKVVTYPDEAGEGPGMYGVCCDRAMECNCRPNHSQVVLESSFFNLGTLEEANAHHQRYHKYLGREEPSPPRTRMQRRLQK
jgi:hypothetical protein